MAQRVRKPHRGKIPSSSGQLPVPVALNARISTLFDHTIHQMPGNVKSNWKKMEEKFIVCLILASLLEGAKGDSAAITMRKILSHGFSCSLG